MNVYLASLAAMRTEILSWYILTPFITSLIRSERRVPTAKLQTPTSHAIAAGATEWWNKHSEG